MMLHDAAYLGLNMNPTFNSEFSACYFYCQKKTVEICPFKFTDTIYIASVFSVNRFTNLFGNKLLS